MLFYMTIANVNGDRTSDTNVTVKVVGRSYQGRNSKKNAPVTRTGINTLFFCCQYIIVNKYQQYI